MTLDQNTALITGGQLREASASVVAGGLLKL
jgi:hypothetical protein